MSEMRFNWSISAIPVDPDFVPSDAALEAARALYAGMSLCTAFRRPLEPGVERHATPRFYGSEMFSYSATCPSCGLVVDRTSKERGTAGRLWFAEVDELAAQGVDGATPVTMPGCGHAAALGAIEFEFPTGAARCALVCDLPVWINGWLEDREADAQAALAALSEALGTPVRLVRRLYALHPEDRRAIALLVSEDAARRLEGLAALDVPRDEDDPEAWPITSPYLEDREERLSKVLLCDARAAVRDRVLSLLVSGKCWSETVRNAIADDLRKGGDAARRGLHQSLYMPRELFRPLLPLVRTLAADPSRLIRSNCAWALRFQKAQGPEDREVLRTLALDFGPVGSHDEAVVAMGDWIKASGAPAQGPDLQVLREVAARFPQSRAGRLASTLIG